MRINKLVALIILLSLPVVVIGQKEDNAEKYAKTITPEDLKVHIDTLASDYMEGRETGMKGQKEARDYLTNFYASIGIEPIGDSTYLQQFPLKRVSSTESTMKLGEEEFTFLEDFYFFGGFFIDSLRAEEIVFGGFGISDSSYNDYESIDVEGKVVLMLSGEPVDRRGKSLITGEDQLSEWSDHYRMKREAAQEHGAKGILIVNQNFDQYVGRIKYYLESPRMQLDDGFQGDEVLPTFFISPEVADYLFKKAGKGTIEKLAETISKKEVSVNFNIDIPLTIDIQRNIEHFTSSNVLGLIEGSDLKDQLIVISAHYDHIGVNDDGSINNGADDDASGTSAVLEMAQAFKKAKEAGVGPRRSILFLHVSGEEKGLLGSQYYTDNPWFPLQQTVSNLNVDMIGRVDEKHADDENYIYVIGADKLSTDLHEINENANDTYTELELDYTYNDPNDPNRFYYRSDHYNFAKYGIPVIFYFSGVHEDYHQPTDTPEKIMHEKTAKIGRLIFHTAWELANRDERIVVDVENEFKER
jgi:hypothetical protein